MFESLFPEVVVTKSLSFKLFEEGSAGFLAKYDCVVQLLLGETIEDVGFVAGVVCL